MLEVTKGIERIILDNPTELDIMNAARANGMTTIREDALLKCAQGLVPFQEVNTL
jgi:type II secretory ATPase GspE/PulE/Tfp pilus assembly ATPase PilB-like protein